MNIIVTGRRVKITDGIRDKVEKMLAKHKRLLDRATKIRVELEQTGAHEGVDTDLAVEIMILMPKVVIKVSEKGGDYYAMIDKLDSVLRRRLVKYRDYQKELRGRHLWKKVKQEQLEDEMELVEEKIAEGSGVE